MGVIKGVLREELENSLRMKSDYERELAILPKGSLIKKKIKKQEYYYLVLREHGKVKFVYKGKASKEEKRIKDRNAAIEILKALMKKGETRTVKQVFELMVPKWRKKAIKGIEEAKEKEILKLLTVSPVGRL